MTKRNWGAIAGCGTSCVGSTRQTRKKITLGCLAFNRSVLLSHYHAVVWIDHFEAHVMQIRQLVAHARKYIEAKDQMR